MSMMPPIRKYMTNMPVTISKNSTALVAQKFMRERKIRHLPVVFENELLGILSERDLYEAESKKQLAKIKVEDVMTVDPYTVESSAPLDEVVSMMAKHKYGCVVVRGKTKAVVGIFTTVDASKVLAQLLKEMMKKGSSVTRLSKMLDYSSKPRWMK